MSAVRESIPKQLKLHCLRKSVYPLTPVVFRLRLEMLHIVCGPTECESAMAVFAKLIASGMTLRTMSSTIGTSLVVDLVQEGVILSSDAGIFKCRSHHQDH